MGAPHRKEFPATKGIPAAVYIEVPVKTTNTSKEPIAFTKFIAGPDFLEYARIKKNSNHWTDISAKGMCGLSYSPGTLAPGESIESTVLISTDHSRKEFRLVLPIATAKSGKGSEIRIKSDAIVLP